jgi:hypothetical protein
MDLIREVRKNYLLGYYKKAFEKQYLRSEKYITDTVMEAWHWMAEYELAVEKGHSDTDIQFCHTMLQDKVKVLMKFQNGKYYRARNDEGKKLGITKAEIERAKEHPFQNLIELDARGMCRCPFHSGTTTTSMSLNKKTNKVRCFSECGKTWDTISFLQELKGLTFTEAVRALL